MKTTIRENNSNPRRPWLVIARIAGALTKRSFSTLAEARAYAAKLEADKTGSPDDKAVQAALGHCAGTTFTLADVIQVGLFHLKHSPSTCSPSATIADGIANFRTQLMAKGALPATLKGYEPTIRRLQGQFGDRKLVSISSDEIASFVKAPPRVDNYSGVHIASAHAQNRTLMIVRAVFRGMGVANPFPSILLLRLPRKSASGVFTTDEVATMLLVARPHERGMLALVIYAGIRPQQLERMQAGSVDVEHHMIQLPDERSLDGRRHTVLTESGNDPGDAVPCLPPVLWAWLKEFPFQPQPWLRIQTRIATALGRWIPNGCRQTAYANYVAVHGSLTRFHYIPVTRQAAERFFALEPAVVLPKPASK